MATLAADSPDSKRISYITSDNPRRGEVRGPEEIAGLLGGKGEYAEAEP